MATTTNYGWETPDDTDLVKDGALAIRTLGSAIDTSLVDLKGGTTGQVLSKASNTDMDFTWIAVDPLTILDAKGDLISATAADTPARLAVGTNGQVLTADSTTATGLKWATPASGGKVLQVVQGTYSTETDNSTTTYADTGLSVNITPSATASKVLVTVSIPTHKTAENAENAVMIKLFRGATEIFFATKMQYTQSALRNLGMTAFQYLDSPSSTSALTYKVQFANNFNGARARICEANSLATIICAEIGA